jgi:hypothetical protein
MAMFFPQHNAQFVIKGRNKTESLLNYVKYLHHIFKPVMESLTAVDRFEGPFYDYLQSPLQPLMDNLESSTYEVFEKDPVKYQRYEDAVHAALIDTPLDKVSLIMVVRRCPSASYVFGLSQLRMCGVGWRWSWSFGEAFTDCRGTSRPCCARIRC